MQRRNSDLTEITVLMAVYNPPLDLLGHAVDSIVGQTRGDFEFLIVDDGSDPAAATPDYLAARASRRHPHPPGSGAPSRTDCVAQPRARNGAGRLDRAPGRRRLERPRAAWNVNSGSWRAIPDLCYWPARTSGPISKPDEALWRTRLPLTSAGRAAAFAAREPVRARFGHDLAVACAGHRGIS